MKTNIRFLVILVLVLVSVSANKAQASLVDRGGGLIYDTDLNITWLADANYGAGSIYDNGQGATDGRMTWDNAVAWASNLSYYDSVRNVTYTDWRLPITLQPDTTCQYNDPSDSHGANCTGSEMGHLFYTELGGTYGFSLSNSTDPDLALFTNVQFSDYWSGTGYALDTSLAWDFSFYHGLQIKNQKGDPNYALAVRDGDVAAVPVPAAIWLFGSGLVGLIGFVCRKPRST